MVLKVVKRIWAEITGMATASGKKKDPPAAKQPQGTKRNGKVRTARIRWWKRVTHAMM